MKTFLQNYGELLWKASVMLVMGAFAAGQFIGDQRLSDAEHVHRVELVERSVRELSTRHESDMSAVRELTSRVNLLAGEVKELVGEMRASRKKYE